MDPNSVGGAILLGLRGVAVVAHGSSSPEGIANAVRLADRAVRERAVERTAELLEASGAPPARPSRDPHGDAGDRDNGRDGARRGDEACPRSPQHRARGAAGEDPAGTRFREDLDADSLDLYELVMELEDRYGIRVSEEEAAEIDTVGDAVDFVCARVRGAPSARAHPSVGGAGVGGGGRPDQMTPPPPRWRSCSRAPPKSCAGRPLPFILGRAAHAVVRASRLPRRQRPRALVAAGLFGSSRRRTSASSPRSSTRPSAAGHARRSPRARAARDAPTQRPRRRRRPSRWIPCSPRSGPWPRSARR